MELPYLDTLSRMALNRCAEWEMSLPATDLWKIPEKLLNWTREHKRVIAFQIWEEMEASTLGWRN